MSNYHDQLAHCPKVIYLLTLSSHMCEEKEIIFQVVMKQYNCEIAPQWGLFSGVEL